MKQILCFGDSNTFGYDAINDGRFSRNERWTGILAQRLGEEYLIIEEGMNGRTTVWDDPVEELESGKKSLPVCLYSHWPLDLVILMLGTNDLKLRFRLEAEDICAGAESLVGLIRSFYLHKGKKVLEILLVSPIEIGPRMKDMPYGVFMGGDWAVSRSKRFADLYKQAAKRQHCHFLAASDYAEACKEDCIHMDRENHRKLALGMEKKVREILG